MKALLHKLSGGQINIHVITFWITLTLSTALFTYVLIAKI